MAEPKKTRGDLGLTSEGRMPAPTMGRRAQRTSAVIAEKARDVFLAKGYFGTSIDDIAEAAGVSRASFYTYYPSKRDLLIKIGNEAYRAMGGLADEMVKVANAGGDDAIAQIVAMYLEFLERDGAFVLVWGQAGFEDEELRRAGMRAKMSGARRLGDALARLGDFPEGRDPALVSLALMVMLDRFWYYYRLADLPATWDEMVATLSSIVAATLGAPAGE